MALRQRDSDPLALAALGLSVFRAGLSRSD